MNPAFDTAYRLMPVFLQDVACSLYGFHLHHQRYGGGLARRLQGLYRFESAGREEVRARQDGEVHQLVSFALASVPYFQRLSRSLGIPPGAIRGVDDLPRLPLLDKEIVRRERNDLRGPRDQVGPCITIATSGTSGTPLRIAVSIAARRRNYGFFLRARRWAGIEGFPPSATFGGRTVVPQDQQGPPYWRANWRARNVLFSSYHLAPATARAYAERLLRLRPVLIDSYPSSVHTLARLALEQDLALPRPTAIVTSSETLYPSARAVVEDAFHCRVFDQYGSAEQVAFISQCEKGSYHVHPDFGVVEIVDDGGAPCSPGQPGEIVATGFTNRAMPLIRYRTGDLARWAERPCACGRMFPVLEELLGRADDMIITPEGRLVGRLDPIFKGMDGIREAQIAQTAPDRIEVRLVADPRHDMAVGQSIRAELARRVGPAMSIAIRHVEAIPRTRGGKFRAVVREFAP